jgi:hypothetical protein
LSKELAGYSHPHFFEKFPSSIAQPSPLPVAFGPVPGFLKPLHNNYYYLCPPVAPLHHAVAQFLQVSKHNYLD